jgi:hypothetical protein|tara:strand:+ start:197 stop:376 length:180 start_codon:yes stop_codon:yes gene_type:complete
VWEDLNQHIRFVDVTEECRSLYGRVQSNCSLLEVGYAYFGCSDYGCTYYGRVLGLEAWQ